MPHGTSHVFTSLIKLAFGRLLDKALTESKSV